MQKNLRAIFVNKFFRGGVFFTVASFIVNLLNYFFHSLVGRSIGPSGYGEITALFSYISITSVPTIVISTVLIQKISSREGNEIQFVRSLEMFFWKRIKKWWYLGVLITAVIPFITRITNLSTISSYALIPLIVLGFIGSFYGAFLQGLHSFFWFSMIAIIAATIKLVGVILPAVGVDGLWTVIIFLLLSAIFAIFLSVYIISRKTRSHKISSKNPINRRLILILFSKQFIITTFSLLAVTSLSNIDIIYVKKFFLPAEAGLYGAWSLFAKIILYVAGPVISVFFVFFAGNKHLKNQNRVFFILTFLLLFLGIISYFGYKFFADILINLLFGKKFLSLTTYLSQASIFGSLYTLIIFINNYFLAKKSFFCLILPFLIPFYIFFLAIIPKNLLYIMNLNIIFSFFTSLIYLFAYFVYFQKMADV